MTSTSAPPSLSGRLSRFTRGCAARCARRPKTVIALWLAFVLACTAAGSIAGTRMLTDSAGNVGPSARAADTLHRAGLTPAATEQILVRSPSAHQTAATSAALAGRARRLATVAAATPSAQSADGGRTALTVVRLRGDPDDADSHVRPLVHLVGSMRAQLPHGVTILQAGDASSDNAVNDVVSSGLGHAEMVAGPLTLIVLVLAFGAIVAAGVPLILGATSVGAALGALGVVSLIAPQGGSTVPVVTLIGLAVGIDYSLFAIRRWRAERRRGAGPQAALDITAATVGRAIVVAGATVIIGLAGLLLSGFAVFESMALGAIVVVAIAVLGSLTVLPAVLTLLGDKIDRGRVWRRRGHRAHSGRRVWERIAAGVTGHPRVALVAALAGLALLAVPALSMRTAVDGVTALPHDLPAARAAQAVARDFPGAGDTETLVVSGRDLSSPRARDTLRQLGARGRTLVGGHGPVTVRISPRGGTVAAVGIPVPSNTRAQSDANVHRLRHGLLPAVTATLPGARAQLTGDDAENVDFEAQLSRTTPLVIGVVLALAFVLLVATFGSARLALAVIGLNVLSVGAAFGVLVAVFQHTWAQGLLGFSSDGAIVNWLPLFAFVVLFGLSMDYTVIVLERAAEARREGVDARTAAARALAGTGATVTSAALIMVCVFAVYALIPMLDFKQMGVGLAAAIALDATLVRAVALPAALTLLGERGLPGRRARPLARRAAAWEHRTHGAILEADHAG